MQQMIENMNIRKMSFALRKKNLFLYKSPLVDAFQKIKKNDDDDDDEENIMNMRYQI